MGAVSMENVSCGKPNRVNWKIPRIAWMDSSGVGRPKIEFITRHTLACDVKR